MRDSRSRLSYSPVESPVMDFVYSLRPEIYFKNQHRQVQA